jgi:DUF4097 and DUF4098 domain-containing protein YvlB
VTLPLVDFDITVPDDCALDLSSHKSEFDVSAPAGRIEIESHKGFGDIRGVRNDFDLDTHKGEFQVEVVQLTDLEVETHKGDVEVTIRGAKDFTIRGDSHEGRLRFQGRDIQVERDPDSDEIEVRHQEGSGRHHIDVSTHKGTIEVEFLD